MEKPYKRIQLVCFGIMAVLLVCCGQSKQQSFLFLEKARGLGDVIIKQAGADVNVCNMYATVWEYARVTDLDFRSAYREMSMDTTNIRAQSVANMEMMEQLMNMVQDPPDDLTMIRDKLIELRESYLEFHDYVMELPQVTQQAFNSKIDAFINRINTLKEELDVQIAQAEAIL